MIGDAWICWGYLVSVLLSAHVERFSVSHMQLFCWNLPKVSCMCCMCCLSVKLVPRWAVPGGGGPGGHYWGSQVNVLILLYSIWYCPHVTLMALSSWYCHHGTVLKMVPSSWPLKVLSWYCPKVAVLQALSTWYCPHWILLLVIYLWSFPHGTVLMVLSLWHFMNDIVLMLPFLK